MKKENSHISQKRKAFNDKFGNYSDSEIQIELLFTQKRALERLERIRKNTSNLVWFLIVIPIIVGVFILAFSSKF